VKKKQKKIGRIGLSTQNLKNLENLNTKPRNPIKNPKSKQQRIESFVWVSGYFFWILSEMTEMKVADFERFFFRPNFL
jgi:hypothetical protein